MNAPPCACPPPPPGTPVYTTAAAPAPDAQNHLAGWLILGAVVVGVVFLARSREKADREAELTERLERDLLLADFEREDRFMMMGGGGDR